MSKEFLEKLFDWGEKAKQTVKESSIPMKEKDYAIQQIESWQEEIYELSVETREDVDREKLLNLRIQGLSLIHEFRGLSSNDSVPYGEHTLPPLPYAYDALEPYISEQIMRLHHTKHHQAYVDGLNKAEKALYTGDKGEEPLKHWLREQAFHGAGHNLHTIFWYNMTPDSSKIPTGEIRSQIEKDFGSWNNFKKLFSDTAKSVEGNGWAALLWSPRSGKLVIQSFEKHQLFQLPDTIPLLVLDVWEHAYYLQHQNDRDSYIDNWWNVVNWDNVNDRFIEAKKVKWTLF